MSDPKNSASKISFEIALIPHSVDGKHSVEAVLTDSRWSLDMLIPRPSITVDCDQPFDQMSISTLVRFKRQIYSVVEKMILGFTALGVTYTIAQRIKAKEALTRVDSDEAPCISLGGGLLPDTLSTLQKASITSSDKK